ILSHAGRGVPGIRGRDGGPGVRARDERVCTDRIAGQGVTGGPPPGPRGVPFFASCGMISTLLIRLDAQQERGMAAASSPADSGGPGRGRTSMVTQKTRPIGVKTPLGEDVLLLRSMTCTEHL